MKPLPASSGDVLADRRAGYAEMLFAAGDIAAAAELLFDALKLAPRWALGWFRLGEIEEAAGALDRAAQAWRTALEIEPADRPGAALKLTLIGRAPQARGPSGAFVETLFDQYAATFDAALVGKLGYRAPEFLDEAIRALGPRRFRLALDLGCGTGLMGERLRGIVERLEGFDISTRMLGKAREKGLYDHLAKADLQAFSRDGEKADLVAAADVFNYVGALDGVFAAIAAMLAEDGLFAFSVEKPPGADGLLLQRSRRYAHSEAYVRRMLAVHGLEILSLAERPIRLDRREPVEGLIVVAAVPLRRG